MGVGLALVELVVAGRLGVVLACAWKRSNGFSRPLPSAVTLVAMIVSFGLLSRAMRSLPLGTAYAIWTGIGAVGAAPVGTVLYGEPATAVWMVCILLIVAGIVGLKLFSGAPA